MVAASLFQSLPLLVVEKTVQYYIGCPQSNHYYENDLGLSLLHSSQRWRQSFAKKALTHVSVYLSEYQQTGILFPLWPASIIGLPPVELAREYAKSINFFYSNWRFIKDTEWEQVQAWAFDKYEFPAVRSLKVKTNLNGRYDDIVSFRNLEHLIKHLFVVAPNIKQVDLSTNVINVNNTQYSPMALVSGIVSGMSEDVDKIVLSNASLSGVFASADFTRFTQLSHLEFDCDGNYVWIHAVVQNNSKTLKYLHVIGLDANCFESMLYNNFNEPLVYSKLETLCYGFNGGCLHYDQNMVCHFPALRKLDINTGISVCSNVFFTTINRLEHLELTVTPDVLQFVKQHDLIKSKYFSKMKTLELRFSADHITDATKDTANNNVAFARQILQMTPQLHKLRICSSFDTSLFMSLLDTHAFSTLHVLSIPHIRLQFSDIVNVLQNTPLLHSLYFNPRNLPPTIDGVSNKYLVKYIQTKWSALSRYLTSLQFAYSASIGAVRNNAMAIALLAVGCPKLSKVYYRDLDTCELVDKLHDLADTREFSRFEEHISYIARNIKSN